MLLFLDTEFTTFLDPEMELLSIGLVSEDGQHQFYGERSDVPEERCSDFVREAVLPLMERKPPVACDWATLRDRLRAFIDQLPELATVACDSWFDFDLMRWLLGETWPERLGPTRLDLGPWTMTGVFAEGQAAFHESGFPYHHALNDARGLRAGYLAWREAQKP
jgi:hypothetical protein